MTELTTPDLVRLDADFGAEKHDVIRGLAGLAAEAGRATDPNRLVEDAFAREATAATGLPGGIAIPHCRTPGVDEPLVAFARLSPAVDFGATDGPADLAFLIAAPARGDQTHLQLLTKLARALAKPGFADALRAASSSTEAARQLVEVLGPMPATPAPPAPTPPAAPETGPGPDTEGNGWLARARRLFTRR